MSERFALDGFEQRFIHHMARKLIGKAGFVASDLEDIKQDLRTDLLCRLSRFDPARSTRHGFSVMRVRRCAYLMLRDRRRSKRNGGLRCVSLNTAVQDPDGRTVELHELIDGHRGRPGRSEEELRDLILDVRSVVGGLEPDLKKWCGVFAVHGIRGGARVRRVPRCRLQTFAGRIREAFGNSGLDSYLRET